MKNKELIHYLNSELQTNKGKLIGIKRGYSIIEDSKFLNGVEYCDIDLQYYLYPLSVLTETINHEGVDEILLVELAKIEGTYKGEPFNINGSIRWNVYDGTMFFGHDVDMNCFYKYIVELGVVNVRNQLPLSTLTLSQ